MFHCFIFETAIYNRKDLNLFVLPWPRSLYFANIIKRGKFKVMLGKKSSTLEFFIIIPWYDQQPPKSCDEIYPPGTWGYHFLL